MSLGFPRNCKHFASASPRYPVMALFSMVILVPLIAADHGHLDVGALGTNQNDQLTWANGADFIAGTYLITMDYASTGVFHGYFQQTNTLMALPRTPANAGPDPAAPALGSFIRARMACLEAPPDGEFAFWEIGATNPTLSLAAGQTSTNTWALTESNGSPGTDPYGHIHGRRFTASKPGLYLVSFQAIDTSTNGADAGPIHLPSVSLPVQFQAGVNVVEVEPDYEGSHVHIRFGARLGYTWQVEASHFLGPQADWQPAGESVIGDDTITEVLHHGDPGAERHYRIKGTPITPQ
jgi:hypothetical protein